MAEYVLGIDGGTECVKSGIYDLEGNTLGIAASYYKTYHEHPGWAEQKIEEWDECLIKSINEAIKTSGIDPKDIIGARFKAAGAVQGTVIGVVRDFNYETLRNDIVPVVTYIAGYVNTIGIRIAPGAYQSAIDHIEKTFAQFNPGKTLEYSFLDERLDALYQNEAAMMELFGYFSLLALIIGCLGLFGLAAFTAEQRTKEIGIRKTLGASVGNITFQLSYQFTQWIFIANLIAIPVIYYFMNDWLNNFAYRTDIEISVFLISMAVSLLIALLSVSWQVLKAALQNPVIALRTE